MQLVQGLLLAILIEAVVENLKWVMNGGWNKERILAFVSAIVITLLSDVDLFAQLGFPLMVPYVGSLLSGVLLARGANVLNDLWTRIERARIVTDGISDDDDDDEGGSSRKS